MSKYTTEVRFVCEYNAGLTKSTGYQTVNQIINDSWQKIFDFDFPIFDETYKPLLCKKILKHFYTREIGEETVGLWKLRLDMRLNEIMPYYNKLYESELIKFNPLYDVDLTRDHNLESNGTRNYTDNGTFENEDVTSTDETIHSTRDDTNSNVNKFSDTPQGSLQNVENGSYLTNATLDNGTAHTVADTTDNIDTTTNRSGETENIGNETTKNIDEYLEHVVGKNGGKSFSQMLKEFRETFLNIDVMIINELDDLFMQVW